MDRYAVWNKKKSSGSFRRSVLRLRKNLLKTLKISSASTSPTLLPPAPVEIVNEVVDSPSPIPASRSPSPDVPKNRMEFEEIVNPDELTEENYFSPSENDGENFDLPDINDSQMKGEPFDVFLRKWAIQFNIRQCALKLLMAKLNQMFKAI